MKKKKLYTYCFRAAMDSTESCKFLDFQKNICFVVAVVR